MALWESGYHTFLRQRRRGGQVQLLSEDLCFWARRSCVDLEIRGFKANASDRSSSYIFFSCLVSTGRWHSNEHGFVRPCDRSILICFPSPPPTSCWACREGGKEHAELCPSCQAACWDIPFPCPCYTHTFLNTCNRT